MATLTPGSKHPCGPPPASLLDIPAPWLRQLIATLCPEEAVALSQTCKTLQHEVFTGRHVTLTAHLHEPGAQQRLISLQRACKLAASVHLKLSGTPPGAPEQAAQLQPTTQTQQAAPPTAQQQDAVATAQAYLANAAATLGQALNKVTHVTLKAMSLTSLAPIWLTDALPQLSDLRLEDVSLSLPAQPAQQTPNTSIKHLTMPALADNRGAQQNTATILAYKQQLESLTALQHLTISTALSRCLVGSICASNTLRGRLCRLALTQVASAQTVLGLLQHALPVLTELMMPAVALGSSVLDALAQSAPAIQTLSCRQIDLPPDYRPPALPWQHVSVSTLDCDSFAKLPLQQLQSISMHACPQTGQKSVLYLYSIVMSATPAANGLVLEAVKRMRGLQWAADTPRVPPPLPARALLCLRAPLEVGDPAAADVEPPRGPLTEAQADQGLQLLSNYHPTFSVTDLIIDCHLAPSTLQLLQQVPRKPAPPTHKWRLMCHAATVDPAVWQQLLPSTSAWHEVYWSLGRMTVPERVLTQVLCAVPRAPRVVLMPSSVHGAEGWPRRVVGAVQRGLQAASQRGVSSVLDPAILHQCALEQGITLRQFKSVEMWAKMTRRLDGRGFTIQLTSSPAQITRVA